MNVTLYQMKAFNQWLNRKAEKKAQQDRQKQVMAVMKKSEPKQLELV